MWQVSGPCSCQHFSKFNCCQFTACRIFQNSIMFENVLNVANVEQDLINIFLNLINERLNGVLPPLDKTLILKATPISSKANSFLVSFHDSFDAKHILDSRYFFQVLIYRILIVLLCTLFFHLVKRSIK